MSQSGKTPPILADKHYGAPSAFTPESLLREARRQRRIANAEGPAICLLDPDGDLGDRLSDLWDAGAGDRRSRDGGRGALWLLGSTRQPRIVLRARHKSDGTDRRRFRKG